MKFFFKRELQKMFSFKMDQENIDLSYHGMQLNYPHLTYKEQAAMVAHKMYSDGALTKDELTQKGWESIEAIQAGMDMVDNLIK